MKIQEHMKLLGIKVKDRITGFEGIATCLSFDLYGCIQALVTPGCGKDGAQKDSRWFDVTRLESKSKSPVMALPNYDYGYVSEGRKGPAEKPVGRW